MIDVADNSNEDAAHPTWFKRFVAGKTGLTLTFWVFSVAIPLAWSNLALLAFEALGLKHRFLLVAVPLAVWVPICTVAVWRAGVVKGRRSVWGFFANFWMCIVSIKVLALLSGALVVSLGP